MELTKISNLGDLKKKISFFNISDEDQSLFDWKSSGAFINYNLDLNNIRKNDICEYYFTIIKGDYKIVFLKKQELSFVIGVEINLQRQLCEALLDAIISEFNQVYDFKVIMSYGSFEPSLLKDFSKHVEEIIDNFEELDLVKRVRISCTVCVQGFSIIIKRTTIEKALHYPVPVVCTHLDHDLLVYIDKDYKVRGMSPITFA